MESNENINLVLTRAITSLALLSVRKMPLTGESVYLLDTLWVRLSGL